MGTRALVLITCFFIQRAIAEDGQGSADSGGRSFLIEKRVDLLPTPLGNFNQKIELGEVPNNADGVLKLNVRNRTNQTIVLGDQFSGCKCTEVTVSSPTIAPSATEEIKIAFSTRNEQDVKKYLALIISSKDSRSDGIRFTIEMNVAAVLSFKAKSVALELDELEDSKTFRIPITLSPPVEAKDVEVTVAGAISVSTDRPVWDEKNETWSVLASLAQSASDGDTGFIRIAHRESGVADEIFCTTRITPNVRLIPSTLRVIWDEDSKAWKSAAAILVSKAWLAANAGDSRDSEANPKALYDISATRVSDLKKLKLRYHELSQGVVKVYLEFGDLKHDPPEVGEISFDIRFNRKSLRTVTSATLGGF